MMRFWNKLHQARSKSQDWNAKKFESFVEVTKVDYA
jgi:hypothetical protein